MESGDPDRATWDPNDHHPKQGGGIRCPCGGSRNRYRFMVRQAEHLPDSWQPEGTEDAQGREKRTACTGAALFSHPHGLG